jgi:hypothetical protein
MITNRVQQTYWEKNLPHSNIIHRKFLHKLRLVVSRASAMRNRKLAAGEGHLVEPNQTDVQGCYA